MSYVDQRLFVDSKILIYPLKGHNIFLIERLFRDIQKNRIKTNKECFKGSVFDDSNEFSARRNNLVLVRLIFITNRFYTIEYLRSKKV